MKIYNASYLLGRGEGGKWSEENTNSSPKANIIKPVNHCGHLELSHIGEFWETMVNMCSIVPPPKRQVSAYLFTCQGWDEDCLQRPLVSWHFRTTTCAAKSTPPGKGMQFWSVGRQAGGHRSGAHGDRVKAPAASTMLAFLVIGIWPCSLGITPIYTRGLLFFLCTCIWFSRGTGCL